MSTINDDEIEEVTHNMSMISFKSILPNAEDVRVTNDTPPLIWAVDLVLAIKGGTRRHAAECLANLSDEVFSIGKIVRKSMPGKGNYNTALVTFEHALDLVMVLPGATAKVSRSGVCDILRGYLAQQLNVFVSPSLYNAPQTSDAQCMTTPMTTINDDEIEEVTHNMSMISFKSILPNAEDVRVTNDTPPLIWAVDLVMAVTGKSRDVAGCTLRNLKSDIFDSMKFIETHLVENGGKKTKLVTFEHALELVMVLPGATAKAIRCQFCDLLRRFFAGDQTLHVQIDANAASTGPIPSLARASVAPAAMAPPTNKRVCLAQPPENLVVHDARNERICNAIAQYRELNGGVIDTEAKAVFSRMLLSNTQALIETPLVPGTAKLQPKKGFIYCLQSSRSGEVKIGYTTNPVKRRLAAINRLHKGLGVVFTYQYSVRSHDCAADEKLAHEHFAGVRVPGSGELFRATPESVRDFFDRVIKPRYLQESGASEYEATDMDMDVEEENDEMDVDDVLVEEAMLPTPTTTTTVVPMTMPTVMPTSMVSVPLVVAAPTPTSRQSAYVFEAALKAFILEHLVYEEGSFLPSCEIREVFLRHSGTDPALFSTAGTGPYTLLGSLLNSTNPKNQVLIENIQIKNKYVKHFKKTAQGYEHLAWKDGPIATVVRAVRSVWSV